MRIQFRIAGSGSVRVLLGGSWYYGPASARVANRVWRKPDARGYNLGFRLILVLGFRLILVPEVK